MKFVLLLRGIIDIEILSSMRLTNKKISYQKFPARLTHAAYKPHKNHIVRRSICIKGLLSLDNLLLLQ